MPDLHLDPDARRWARAREDYRAGLTGAEVCARHGIGRSAFYARAQAERWRRADLPSQGAGAAEDNDDFDPAAPRASAAQMAEQAYRRLSHAIAKGRLKEALGWSRLGREMRDLASAEEAGSWKALVCAERDERAAARTPSPAENLAQAPVVAEEKRPQPDCPDSFRESAVQDVGDAEAADLPPAVMAACREILLSEPDKDAAWEAILPILKAARPDLPWDGDWGDDEWEGEEPP